MVITRSPKTRSQQRQVASEHSPTKKTTRRPRQRRIATRRVSPSSNDNRSSSPDSTGSTQSSQSPPQPASDPNRSLAATTTTARGSNLPRAAKTCRNPTGQLGGPTQPPAASIVVGATLPSTHFTCHNQAGQTGGPTQPLAALFPGGPTQPSATNTCHNQAGQAGGSTQPPAALCPDGPTQPSAANTCHNQAGQLNTSTQPQTNTGGSNQPSVATNRQVQPTTQARPQRFCSTTHPQAVRGFNQPPASPHQQLVGGSTQPLHPSNPTSQPSQPTMIGAVAGSAQPATTLQFYPATQIQQFQQHVAPTQAAAHHQQFNAIQAAQQQQSHQLQAALPQVSASTYTAPATPQYTAQQSTNHNLQQPLLSYTAFKAALRLLKKRNDQIDDMVDAANDMPLNRQDNRRLETLITQATLNVDRCCSTLDNYRDDLLKENRPFTQRESDDISAAHHEISRAFDVSEEATFLVSLTKNQTEQKDAEEQATTNTHPAPPVVQGAQRRCPVPRVSQRESFSSSPVHYTQQATPCEVPLTQESEQAANRVCAGNDHLATVSQPFQQPMTTTAGNTSARTEQVIQQTSKTNFHLPRLDIPKYNGELQQWKPFYDMFKSTVDADPSLTPVMKLHYMKSYLEGEAAKVIAHLAPENQNYKVALDLLKQTFENAERTKTVARTKLFSLEPATKSVESLRRFKIELESCLQCLESLGENLEHGHYVDLIFSKLPHSMIVQLQRTQTSESSWTVKNLREQLKVEIRAQEAAAVYAQSSRSEEAASTGEALVANVNWKTRQQHWQPQSRWEAKRPQNESTRERQTKPRSNCIFCGGTHWNSECSVHKTVKARKEQLYNQRRCFRCLRQGHSSNKCNVDQTQIYCHYCRKKGVHLSPLCPERTTDRHKQYNTTLATQSQNQNLADQQGYDSYDEVLEEDPNETSVIGMTTSAINTPKPEETEVISATMHEGYTYLETAIHRISSSYCDHPEFNVRALHDTASNRSYVIKSLADKLKLKPLKSEVLKIETFGANQLDVATQVAEIKLHLPNHDFIRIKVNIVERIMKTLHRAPIPRDIIIQLPKGIVLADPPPRKPENQNLELLIGQNAYHDIVTGEKIKIKNGPYLVSSKVGWIVAGTIDPLIAVTTESPSVGQIMSTVARDRNYNHKKEKLQPTDPTAKSNLTIETEAGTLSLNTIFSLETIGINDGPAINDDDVALAEFNARVEFRDGRYYVPWLWRSNVDQLPTNFHLAKGRFESTVKRLSKEPEKLKKYNATIKAQEEVGVIELVTDPKTKNRLHYISHHGVETPHKTTTKLRVVYDASAKEGKSKPSLNECLYRGPLWLENLVAILLRFRMHQIALVSDIEKAFLQVGLLEDERDVTRFFWIKNINYPDLLAPEDIAIYRFTRVPFGFKSSPFLLDGAVVTHMINDPNDHDIAQDIIENHYVDNIASGCSSPAEAKRYYTVAKAKFDRASINLREWNTNDSEVFQAIPEKDRTNDASMKVLGIHWHTKSDTIQISTQSEKKDSTIPEKITKRNVLSLLSQVFDPFGFLSPITVRARILLQDLFKDDIGWDQQIPEQAAKTFREIHRDQLQAGKLTLPRFVMEQSAIPGSTLHCFCDASTKAFGAVIYITHNDLSQPKILYSKNRVAPKSAKAANAILTLPRLELMGILIGVRALRFVQTSLKAQCKMIVWSDSQIALSWIDSTKALGTFVRNRVSEINKPPRPIFKYIPSEENPADISSRGGKLEELNSQLSCQWWQGPEWLTKSEAQWPKWKRETAAEENSIAEVVLATNQLRKIEIPRLDIQLERFSSSQRLIRSVAYCLRFAKRRKVGEIAVGNDEFREAQIFLIRQIQYAAYEELSTTEISKTAIGKQLGLFTDNDGILRCSGRLGKMDAEEKTKFPVLLPPKNWFTVLVVKRIHEINGHAGPNHTLAETRRSYWIPKGPSAVKSITSKCVTCRKAGPKPFRLPKMPELPVERVTKSAPFTHTGLDYFGHLFVFDKKQLPPRKVWVCLFTCLSVRAVHLEIVEDNSAAQFLLALRRFMATYTIPTTVVCDNAPQFKLVAAKTQQVLGNIGISWKFIVEYAPWQGGVYERMVQTVKRVLKKILGKAKLSESELQTILKEVQNIVNNRPLTTLSAESLEKILCPNDFLYPFGKRAPGGMLPSINEASPVGDQDIVWLWKEGQDLVKQFWEQWQSEYLLGLRSAMRWEHKQGKQSVREEPKPDTVVLVKRTTPPVKSTWAIAKVEGLIRSKDGACRAVTLRQANGSRISRPINLISPIEVQEFPATKKMHQQLKQSAGNLPTPTRVQPPRQVKPSGTTHPARSVAKAIL